MVKRVLKTVDYERVLDARRTGDDYANELPRRQDFIDKTLSAQIDDLIIKRAPIYFMPNDVQERGVYLNGVNKYTLKIIGIIPDGRKVCINLSGVDVYFDLRVPKWFFVEDKSKLTAEFMLYIQSKLVDKRILYTKMEGITGYPFMDFQKSPVDYIRIYFNNLQDRHVALDYVHGMTTPDDSPMETAADDDVKTVGYSISNGNNFYYHKTAREHRFNTCSWNTLENYSVVNLDLTSVQSIPVANCSLYFDLHLDNYKPVPDSIVTATDYLNRDRTIVAAWDIETYNFGPDDIDLESADLTIFMICLTFHFHYTNEALLKICIMDVPAECDDWVFYDEEEIKKLSGKFPQLSREEIMFKLSQQNIMVICGSQRNILRAFTDVLKRMSPDIMVAFNGGAFDWPRVRTALSAYNLCCDFKNQISCIGTNVWSKDGKQYGDTEEGVRKNGWSGEKVKISPEESASMVRLNMPGIIDTDCMVLFKQLYPRYEVGNKFSLNYFLQKNNLKGKEDMPYKTMFRYYENSLRARDMKNFLENYDTLADNIARYIGAFRADHKCKSNITDDIKCTCYDLNNTFLSNNVIDEFLSFVTLVDKQMGEVAKYCIVDAYRCQQLFNVQTIIIDKRELSNTSYTSLYAGFYRAGGMKVRNLTGAECYATNYMYSTYVSSNIKVKYPGAWVFPPEKGLNTDRPVVGLDFASLYPSIIMAYNLSPEKSIMDTAEGRERAAELTAQGYILHRIEFKSEVNDGSSSDGQLIPTAGWSIRHSNVFKKGDRAIVKSNEYNIDREALAGEDFGIFPRILMDLFNKRRTLKKRFVALSKLVELLERYPIDEIPAENYAPLGYTKETLSLEDVVFDRNKVNSKQKSMKVYMNTFYGEQGNSRSGIYKLLIAGAITSAGRYNIKLVAKYLEDNLYKLWYGDTDSAYLSCNHEIFHSVDAIYKKFIGKICGEVTIRDFVEKIPNDEATKCRLEFNAEHRVILDAYHKSVQDLNKIKDISINDESAKLFEKVCGDLLAAKCADVRALIYKLKELYWIQKIQITRRDVTTLRGRVNSYLALDNGTNFLTMDYEEVLFPVVFTGKKKYFGLAHIAEEILYPKREEIFIRGIDFIKQGQADLSKDIGITLIEHMCSVENEMTVLELVVNKLKEIYSTNWDVNQFTLNAKYRPGKKNVAVNSFVERMDFMFKKHQNINNELAYLYKPPDAGDPFKYVIVKKPQKFNIRGCKIPMKKSDKMEYVSIYKKFKEISADSMNIDLNHYMSGAIVSLLARFISYMEEFNQGIEIDSEKVEMIKDAPVDDFVETDIDKLLEDIKKTPAEDDLPDEETSSDEEEPLETVKKTIDKIEATSMVKKKVLDLDAADLEAMKRAKKYIQGICDKLSNGETKEELRARGARYRKITTVVNNLLYADLHTRYGDEVSTILVDIDFPVMVLDDEELFKNILYKNHKQLNEYYFNNLEKVADLYIRMARKEIYLYIKHRAEDVNYSLEETNNVLRDYLFKRGDFGIQRHRDLYNLKIHYNKSGDNLYSKKMKYFSDNIAEYKKAIDNVIFDLLLLVAKHSYGMNNIIDLIRKDFISKEISKDSSVEFTKYVADINNLTAEDITLCKSVYKNIMRIVFIERCILHLNIFSKAITEFDAAKLYIGNGNKEVLVNSMETIIKRDNDMTKSSELMAKLQIRESETGKLVKLNNLGIDKFA